MTPTRWTRLVAALRQQRVHRAFRIAPPVWDDAQRRNLARFVADPPTPRPATPTPTPPPTPPPILDEGALAKAVTNLWRALRRVEHPAADLAQQARQVRHYLRNSRDELGEAGVEILDHDGAVYHVGQALDVVQIEHDPNLAADVEVVRQTVRPSIYLADRRLQMGQVIIGSSAVQDPTGDHHA